MTRQILILTVFFLLTVNSFGQQDNKKTFYSDTISQDSLANKKIIISVDLDSANIKYNRCSDCFVVEIKDQSDKNIATLFIDSKGVVRSLTEGNPSGVYINYSKDGNIAWMEYNTKKGKHKQFFKINKH